MKRTDLDRRERELKRAKKKAERLERDGGRERTVGDYIDELHDLFFHDGTQIYNTETDERILELLEDMKDDLDEKHWDNVIRKAVKKSGVKKREEAIKGLKALM